MICLSEAEIRDLTHLERPSAQMRFFNRYKIPAVLRPDNTVLVLRAAVETALGLQPPSFTHDGFAEPDWNYLLDE